MICSLLSVVTSLAVAKLAKRRTNSESAMSLRQGGWGAHIEGLPIERHNCTSIHLLFASPKKKSRGSGIENFPLLPIVVGLCFWPANDQPGLCC
jgi:hypothetical protein